MGPLKLAFVGGGAHSRLGALHYGAATLDARWQLHCGAFSRDMTQSRRSGVRWGVAPSHCHEDWQDMLLAHGDELDAVVLLTPPQTQAQVMRAALRQGLAVLAVPPLGDDVSDLSEASNEQQAQAGFVWVLHELAGYPMLRELRQRLRRNVLGELWQFELNLPLSFLLADTEQEAVSSLDFQPGRQVLPRVLCSLGSQALLLSHFLLGQWPSEVFCELAGFAAPRSDVPDTAYLLLRYANGLRGRIWLSAAAAGSRDGLSLRVHGSRGQASWQECDANQLWLSSRDGSQHLLAPGAPKLTRWSTYRQRYAGPGREGALDALANGYSDAADALLGFRAERKHHPLAIGLPAACEALSLLAAALRSAGTERWVEVGTQRIAYHQGRELAQSLATAGMSDLDRLD